MDDWITTQEAAEITGYNVQHVRRLAREGSIVVRKWGKEWMISKSSILDYANQEDRGPREKPRKP